jgi:SAM-dependent methyltransferase
VKAAKWLIRLGRFIDALAIMVMRPEDLAAYTRETYTKPHNRATWTHPEQALSGFDDIERSLLERLPVKKGRAMVLGVGGGRDVLALAREGFDITGIDFVQELMAVAEQLAAAHQIKFEGSVQDITRLQPLPALFELVWFSKGMYSAVPTRERRIRLLSTIRRALKPGGCCVCQYRIGSPLRFSVKVEAARRLMAAITAGNRSFEAGDILWSNAEFVHVFETEGELLDEFHAAGWRVVHQRTDRQWYRGESILMADRADNA